MERKRARASVCFYVGKIRTKTENELEITKSQNLYVNLDVHVEPKPVSIGVRQS